jgi:hypothetical protein
LPCGILELFSKESPLAIGTTIHKKNVVVSIQGSANLRPPMINERKKRKNAALERYSESESDGSAERVYHRLCSELFVCVLGAFPSWQRGPLVFSPALL